MDDKLTKLALAIAAEGWPPVACRADKIPAHKGWYENADCDPGRIRADFGWGVVKLISVPTGSKTGIIAVDVDTKHGRCYWHETNKHRLSNTRVHTTPSGGLHYLFSLPPGMVIRCSASKLAPNVDIRGERGHVGWPGVGGRRVANNCPVAPLATYPWLLEALVAIQPTAEETNTVLPCPPWLQDCLLYPGCGVLAAAVGVRDPADEAASIIVKEIGRVANAVQGNRHYALVRAAYTCGGYLWLAGVDEDRMVRELLDALQGAGIDYKLAEQTARYQIEKGRGRPMHPDERDTRFADLHRIGHNLIDTGTVSASLLEKCLLMYNEKELSPPLPIRAVIAQVSKIMENHQ